ncbi:hypothetical protein GGX14DRAFT_353595 [Mycena pura]|uniref:Uncharacterized protein n=1 Tax=Mycena pura TaxID=153505 RepID=A0AAD6VTF3_9AGAR|nr:hypothetical protein GGX14DRAFT_353595 [Mycena pura]
MSNQNEKEWGKLKLTPITGSDDGSNNYAEFKQKAKLKLDAAKMWKYVDGPEYKPPNIPALIVSESKTGVTDDGITMQFHTIGNEVEVNVARKAAEEWLDADKKTLAIIAEAVPSRRLYLLRDCSSANDLWTALKNHYEPGSTLMAVSIRTKLMGFKCGTEKHDMVHWRETMVQLYHRLSDADPETAHMADLLRNIWAFARLLVTLMTDAGEWHFCRDDLRNKVRESTAVRKPMSSSSYTHNYAQDTGKVPGV